MIFYSLECKLFMIITLLETSFSIHYLTCFIINIDVIETNSRFPITVFFPRYEKLGTY